MLYFKPQNCNAAFHLGPLCLWISSLQKTLMRYPFLFILSIKEGLDGGGGLVFTIH